VEIDFNKDFLAEINMMVPNYVWVQKFDYENVSFQCRACYEMGHVIKNFPKCLQNDKDRIFFLKTQMVGRSSGSSLYGVQRRRGLGLERIES